MSPVALALSLLFALSPFALSKRAEDPCKPCRDMAKSFGEGMERTREKNAGGGNSKWEEGNLRRWANSELRLVEISEGLCGRGDRQGHVIKKKKLLGEEGECLSFYGEHEEEVEEWWFSEGRQDAGLFSFLCVGRARVCCPEGTFGRECRPCPGGEARPCSSRGQCAGEGTRSGTGTCSCQEGYTGIDCSACKEGYYREGDNCLACHHACSKGCSGPGPSQCAECKEGFTREAETASCIPCSPSCATCSGEPQNCLQCAVGYAKEDEGEGEGRCRDVDECTPEREDCPASSSVCINTPGSFTCQCREGFSKDGEGRCQQQQEQEEQKEERKEQEEEQAPKDEL